MPQEFDEFGIPIKTESKQNSQVDEFGIPIKKKEASSQGTPTTSTPTGGTTPQQQPPLQQGTQQPVFGESPTSSQAKTDRLIQKKREEDPYAGLSAQLNQFVEDKQNQFIQEIEQTKANIELDIANISSRAKNIEKEFTIEVDKRKKQLEAEIEKITSKEYTTPESLGTANARIQMLTDEYNSWAEERQKDYESKINNINSQIKLKTQKFESFAKEKEAEYKTLIKGGASSIQEKFLFDYNNKKLELPRSEQNQELFNTLLLVQKQEGDYLPDPNMLNASMRKEAYMADRFAENVDMENIYSSSIFKFLEKQISLGYLSREDGVKFINGEINYNSLISKVTDGRIEKGWGGVAPPLKTSSKELDRKETERLYEQQFKDEILSYFPEEYRKSGIMLSRLEDKLWKERDVFMDFTGDKAVGGGALNIPATFGKFISDLAFNVSSVSYDLAAELVDAVVPETKTVMGTFRVGDALRTLAEGAREDKQRVSEFFGKEIRKVNKGIVESLKDGDLSSFFNLSLQTAAGSISVMIPTAMVGASTKNPYATYLTMATLGAAQTYEDVRNEEPFKQLTTEQKGLYLLQMGAFEAVGEMAGYKFAKQVFKDVGKKATKEFARKSLKDFVKATAAVYGMNMAENQLGELTTTLGQYLTEKAAYGGDISFDELTERFKETVVSTLGMDLLFTAVGAGGKTLNYISAKTGLQRNESLKTKLKEDFLRLQGELIREDLTTDEKSEIAVRLLNIKKEYAKISKQEEGVLRIMEEQDIRELISLNDSKKKLQTKIGQTSSEVLKEELNKELADIDSKISQIEEKYANQQVTNQQVTTEVVETQQVEQQLTPEELEAKKADIQKRRQEELEAVRLAIAKSEQTGEIQTVNGRPVNKGTLDEINAKYDAELSALEQQATPTQQTQQSETQQTTAVETEVAQPTQENKKASDLLDNFEKGTDVSLDEFDEAGDVEDGVIKSIFEQFKKAFKNIRIVGKRPTEGAAFYDTNEKRIEVNKNSTHWKQVDSKSLIGALVHEFVHESIDKSENKDRIESDLQRIKDDLISNPPTVENESDKKLLGYITAKNNSPQEVLTYMASNPELRKYLSKHTDKLNEISQELFGVDVMQQEKQVKDEKDGQRPKAGNRIFNKPLEAVKGIADKYYQRVFGKKRPAFNGVTGIDKELAKRISDAYDAMKNDPNDPEVRAAYEALAKETMEQYKAFAEAGYTIEINNEEPYNNAQEMIDDLRENKRMKIFSTESGFGGTPITEQQRRENPLLRDSGVKDVNGNTLLVNDIFRAIHDFYGHAELGNGFGAIGEENAWNVHARMFSPLARRAMTTETRGQNSWVNFSGVNEEAFKLRDKARQLRREGKEEEAQAVVAQVYEIMSFAEQKVGLLPVEFSEPTETKQDDTQAKQQVPSGKQEGKATEQAKPKQEPSGKKAEAGGDVQAPTEKEVEASTKKTTAYHNKNGGSTVTQKGKVLEDGYSVSPYPERTKIVKGKKITEKDIKDFKEANKDILEDNPNALVGTWYDSESGNTYIDISIHEKNLEEAKRIGRKFNQKAIYDLKNKKEIDTGGTGEAIKQDSKNVIDGSNVAKLRELISNVDESKKSVVRAIINGLRATIKVLPNKFKGIKLVTNTKEFAEIAGETEEYVRDNDYGGFFDDKENIIYINLETATAKTIAHELFHAILYNSLGGNNARVNTAAANMIGSLRRAMRQEMTDEMERDIIALENAVRNGVYKSSEVNEEALGRLIERLTSNFANLKPNVKQIIKNAINKFLNYVGLGKFQFAQAKTDQDVIDFFNTVPKMIMKGEVISELDIDFSYAIDKVSESTSMIDKKKQAAIFMKDSEANKKLGIPKKGATNRIIGEALESYYRNKFGIIKRNDRSEGAISKISSWMAAEAAYFIELLGEASGIGWYGKKYQSAIDSFAEVFPELKSDKKSRDFFTLLVAITSDGTEVVQNFKNAASMYSKYKETGILENVDAGRSYEGSVKKINTLLDKFNGDTEKVRAYLLKIDTAKNIGLKKSDWGMSFRMPVAAAYLSPKLGMFYANLMGIQNYPTLDRWWSRSFNRYRGTLLPKISKTNLKNFKQLLGEEMSDDSAIEATLFYQNKLKERGFKTELALLVGKSEPKKSKDAEKWHDKAKELAGENYEYLLREHYLERAANTIAKSAFQELNDAPFNTSDRVFMYEAIKAARNKLRNRGYKDISIADVQAVLWYFEKQLYSHLGAKPPLGISYEEAAKLNIEFFKENGNWEYSLADKETKKKIKAKQIVSIDSQDLEKTNQIKKAEEPSTKKKSVKTNTQEAEETKNMFAEQEDALFEASKKNRDFSKTFWNKWFDRQSNIRKALTEANAKLARAIMTTKAGAIVGADRAFKKIEKVIYGGLSLEEEKLMDMILFHERVIQIDSNFDAKESVRDAEAAYWENEAETVKKTNPSLAKKYKRKAKEVREQQRPKHPRGFNKERSEAALEGLKEDFGDVVYDKVYERAQMVFEQFNKIMEKMYEFGLVDKGTYDRFKNDKYIPRQFLHHLFAKQVVNSAQGTGLRSAQIQAIDGGSEELAFMDSRILLSSAMRSLSNRKFQNDANNALAAVLKKMGELPWLREANYEYDKKTGLPKVDAYGNKVVKDADRGFVNMNFFVDGKRDSFQMSEELYQEWMDIQEYTDPAWGKFLRTALLTDVIKTFATRQNPAFFIANVPIDYTNVILFTDIYDDKAFLGSAMFDLAKRFTKMASGVAAINGRQIAGMKESDKSYVQKLFNEAIEHGLMMEFLSVYGKPDEMFLRDKAKKEGKIRKGISLLGEKVSESLSFTGEVSEVAMRLSVYEKIREDLIKASGKTESQLTKQEMDEIAYQAAEKARNTIDFSQGGRNAKKIDVFFAYFNAAAQSFRISSTYIKNNPKKFASKMMQMAMPVAALMLYNMMVGDDDDWEEISEFEKKMYFIILSPLKGEDGKRKYIKIRKHPQAAPFFNIIEYAVMSTAGKQIGKNWSDDVDFGKETVRSFNDAMPFPTGLDIEDGRLFFNPSEALAKTPPAIQALTGYVANFDMFRGEQITRDKDVFPVEKEGFFDTHVPIFYKEMGERMGMSPARSKMAVEKVITTPSTNVIVGMTYTVLDAATTAFVGNDKYTQVPSDYVGVENIGKSFTRKFIGETKPYLKEGKAAEMGKKFELQENFKSREQKETIKRFIDESKSLSEYKANVKKYIKENVPLEDKMTIVNYAQTAWRTKEYKSTMPMYYKYMDVMFTKDTEAAAMKLALFLKNADVKSEDFKTAAKEMSKLGFTFNNRFLMAYNNFTRANSK